MPHINDLEPIEIDGKIVYESELDRIKQMYGFGSRYPIGSGDDPEDSAGRYLARLKYKRSKK